jgi:hypothetical protein
MLLGYGIARVSILLVGCYLLCAHIAQLPPWPFRWRVFGMSIALAVLGILSVVVAHWPYGFP